MSEQATCTACGGSGVVTSVRSSGPVERECFCRPRTFKVGITRPPITVRNTISLSKGGRELLGFGATVSVWDSGFLRRRFDSLTEWARAKPWSSSAEGGEFCVYVPVNVTPILEWAKSKGHDIRSLLADAEGGGVTDGQVLSAHEISHTLLVHSVESIAAGGGPVLSMQEIPDDDGEALGMDLVRKAQ